MPVRFQLVIDCADPDRLARFWAAALGYELAPVPAGFATWNDFYRELGVPEEELADGADRISDPEGHGPAIWFHVVPDAKAVKNRLHLDIAPVDRTRDEEVERLVALGAHVAADQRRPNGSGWVVMTDPEGNEFCVERSDAEVAASRSSAGEAAPPAE